MKTNSIIYFTEAFIGVSLMRLKGMKIQINKTYTWIDKFFVLLITISPILQHYKGIFVDSGALVLILGSLYAIIKMLKKSKISQRSIVVVGNYSDTHINR